MASAIGLSMSTAALFLLAFLLVSNDSVEGRVYRVKSNINLTKPKPSPAPSNRTCRAHSNPQLHVIMDRVCELCHEMFSYMMPNFRAECSERCYKNSKFRNCLNMFSVLPPDHPGGMEFTRFLMMRMDAAEEEAGQQTAQG